MSTTAPGAAERLLAVARARAALRSGRARELRELFGLTRRELARALGVAHTTVVRWERLERAPRPEAAERLHAFLAALEATVLAEGRRALNPRNDDDCSEKRPPGTSRSTRRDDSTAPHEHSRATVLQVFVPSIVGAIEGARGTMRDDEYVSGLEIVAGWLERELARARKASRQLRAVS